MRNRRIFSCARLCWENGLRHSSTSRSFAPRLMRSPGPTIGHMAWGPVRHGSLRHDAPNGGGRISVRCFPWLIQLPHRRFLTWPWSKNASPWSIPLVPGRRRTILIHRSTHSNRMSRNNAFIVLNTISTKPQGWLCGRFHPQNLAPGCMLGLPSEEKGCRVCTSPPQILLFTLQTNYSLISMDRSMRSSRKAKSLLSLWQYNTSNMEDYLL